MPKDNTNTDVQQEQEVEYVDRADKATSWAKVVHNLKYGTVEIDGKTKPSKYAVQLTRRDGFNVSIPLALASVSAGLLTLVRGTYFAATGIVETALGAAKLSSKQTQVGLARTVVGLGSVVAGGVFTGLISSAILLSPITAPLRFAWLKATNGDLKIAQKGRVVDTTADLKAIEKEIPEAQRIEAKEKVKLLKTIVKGKLPSLLLGLMDNDNELFPKVSSLNEIRELKQNIADNAGRSKHDALVASPDLYKPKETPKVTDMKSTDSVVANKDLYRSKITPRATDPKNIEASRAAAGPSLAARK